MLSLTFNKGKIDEAMLILDTGEKLAITPLDPSRRPEMPPSWRLLPLAGHKLPDFIVALAGGGPMKPTVRGYVPNPPSEDELSELYQATLNASSKLMSFVPADITTKIDDDDIRRVDPAFRAATVDCAGVRSVSGKQKTEAVKELVLAFINFSCLCKSPIVVQIRLLDASLEQNMLEKELCRRFMKSV